MLSVADAQAAVLRDVAPLPGEAVPLPRVVGRVLAEDIIAEIDSPPFDKSMMDGFALRAADTVGGADTAGGAVRLTVLETVTAGRLPTRTVEPGTGTRIMTGAPLPAGADAVVPVEQTQSGGDSAADTVLVNTTVQAGAHILRRGASLKAGETVYAAGRRLRPHDLGVLAELGVSAVPVRRRPRVAILATGDELVPPNATPGPGQIRNSNESLLIGLVAAVGGEPLPLGIARDTPDDLRTHILRGLNADLLLLSGGVSAGTLDLVPQTLAAAGVQPVFHKVNVKPGKPVYFGRQRDRGTLVFGLPGNPVSVLVCFELFARPALAALLGQEPPVPLRAMLTIPFENRGDRPTYHPAALAVDTSGRLTVTPTRWAGSADLRATALANASVLLEPTQTYAAESLVAVLPWPNLLLTGEQGQASPR